MALLINQLDEHNESGIIYLIKNKIEEVLFLYDTEQIDLMKSIREYYSSNFSDIKLYEEIVTEGNIDGLRNILKKYKKEDKYISALAKLYEEEIEKEENYKNIKDNEESERKRKRKIWFQNKNKKINYN